MDLFDAVTLFRIFHTVMAVRDMLPRSCLWKNIHLSSACVNAYWFSSDN